MAILLLNQNNKLSIRRRAIYNKILNLQSREMSAFSSFSQKSEEDIEPVPY